MDYLNLGCGSRFHREWVNLDLEGRPPHVGAHDLRHDLPFPNAAFDVVYHSHVLEHLTKTQAPRFLKECFRVLKSGGVLRVVVPDLEGIAKAYLEALFRAEAKAPGGAADHEWMMLEMYDQTVRECCGGEMLLFLQRNPIPNMDFVIKRCGSELIEAIGRSGAEREGTGSASPAKRGDLKARLDKLLSFRRYCGLLRELLLKLVLGHEYRALEIGRFRLNGEIHQWMYDRFSLIRLMEKSGFEGVIVRDAFTSYIDKWTLMGLDIDADGSIYKPDSLYVEGLKP